MSGCNWGKLFSQNRVKAIGVPWSSEELKAVYELKIPAEFVRNGCLTLEEYLDTSEELKAKEEKGEDKPLQYQTKQELGVVAGELGIQFTPETTELDLINLINVKQSKLPADDNPDSGVEKKPFCDKCDSKGVRHKKGCPNAKATKSVKDS